MLIVAKRELHGYFMSPIGYVFIGFFLLVSGLLFFLTNLSTSSGDIAGLLTQLTTILLFLVPVLTMRLFSEERKNKSEQLLLTSPLSLSAIVTGKFLAAVVVYLITLGLTGLYVLTVELLGKLYVGEVLTGYLGIFLLGCCYISVGVLVSALTESQVSAAVASFALNFLIWMLGSVSHVIPVRLLSKALAWLSLTVRYDAFANAQLKLSNVVYLVSFCAVFLFLTVRVIDKRRWSDG